MDYSPPDEIGFVFGRLLDALGSAAQLFPLYCFDPHEPRCYIAERDAEMNATCAALVSIAAQRHDQAIELGMQRIAHLVREFAGRFRESLNDDQITAHAHEVRKLYDSIIDAAEATVARLPLAQLSHFP